MNIAALHEAAASGAAHTPPATSDKTALFIDGDALAYRCAGQADRSFADAVDRAEGCIAAAASASGAGFTTLLFTAPQSRKGGRFEFATVKPYQANRGGRVYAQPNREPLRRRLAQRYANDFRGDVWEADDGFDVALACAQRAGYEKVVLHYDDKDMRQIPGVHHLTWVSLDLLPPGTTYHDGKLYGPLWLLRQALHGDTSDNVPGLPYIINAKGKQALCGPATAEKILGGIDDVHEAFDAVCTEYRKVYGPLYGGQLVEQLLLLGLGRIGALAELRDSRIVAHALSRRAAFAETWGALDFNVTKT